MVCSLVVSHSKYSKKSLYLFLIGFSEETGLTNKELTVVKSFVNLHPRTPVTHHDPKRTRQSQSECSSSTLSRKQL